MRGTAFARKRRVALWAVLGVWVWLAALSVPAQPLKRLRLAWDAQPEAAGYKIYYGVSSRRYTNSIATGARSAVTVPNLCPGVTYYFAVTVSSRAGLESDYSPEISYTIPLPPRELLLRLVSAVCWRLAGVSHPGHVYEILATWVMPQSGRALSPKAPFSGRLGEAAPHKTEGLPTRRFAAGQALGSKVTVGSGSFLLPVESKYRTQLFRLHDTTSSGAQRPASLSLRLTATRQPLLSGVGAVGCTYQLLASDDLAHWTPIASVLTPATGRFQFTDPRPATNACRFYRLRQVDP